MNQHLKRATAAAALTAALIGGGASVAGASSRTEVMSGLTNLSTDIHNMTTAAQTSDLGAMQSACSSIQSDANDMLTYDTRPRSVPRRAWRLLRQALRLEVLAGEQCEIGARDVDPNAIELATSYLDQGTAKLNAAADAMGV
jgi:hypothetical protein